MAERIPWKFTDTETAEVYYLPVNPNSDGGSFNLAKNQNYSITAGDTQGSRSKTLVFASGVELGSFSYSGNLYSSEQLLAFEDWFSRDYPFEIEDDLGRKILAMVELFEIKRARSRHHIWKHTYTFSGSILEEL